jgi:hypothetical protein
MSRIIGFYKKNGRTRPITRRSPRRKRSSTSTGHLYQYVAKKEQEKKFEREYGKKRGDYIYGATVGKVRRERLAKMAGGKR